MEKNTVKDMEDEVEKLHSNIGQPQAHKQVVLRARCPFCNDRVTFRQLEHSLTDSRIVGNSVALQCEGCHSICSYSLREKKFYPSAKIKGLEGLPTEIEKYYKEALRCLEADSPNGAVTLFRKIIHALGINYGIAEKNDRKSFVAIVTALYLGEHIVEKLRDALLGIKDIGNDGAHINDNEPDMEQAKNIRKLVDTVLNSTILCDSSLEFLKEKHSGKE